MTKKKELRKIRRTQIPKTNVSCLISRKKGYSQVYIDEITGEVTVFKNRKILKRYLNEGYKIMEDSDTGPWKLVKTVS